MAKSTVPIELPAAPTADLHAATKAYVDTGLALKPGMPYIGTVPSGSTTPTITHNLGTADVDVTVYRVSDGIQVGVPADRVNTNSVQLTFSTAPTSGQYRVVVSAGTGAGGPGGGGSGGPPEPHAASHAEGGTDPLSPEMIGASADDHDHAGSYASVVHNHSGLTPQGGVTGQVLTKNSSSHYDYSWQDPTGGGGGSSSIKPYPPVALSLTDYLAPNGVTYKIVQVNAALGTHFRITPTTSCQVINPSNPTNGQTILFEIRLTGTTNYDVQFLATTPSGWAHQTTWTFGDVAVGTTIAGTTDYVTAIYDERASSGAGRWRVIGVTKGFPN